MYLDMTGVDHQPLKVSVVHQGLQNLFPDSLVTPPAEPAVYIFPAYPEAIQNEEMADCI